MVIPGDSIISSTQFCRNDLEELAKMANKLESVARGHYRCDLFSGAILGNLFFEPSTRSRISLGAAFTRLGGKVLDTTGMNITSIIKGESLSDTSRVISGYVDIISLRHPHPDSVSIFSKSSLVPVINAGDGTGEHPTQSLTDFYTIHKELVRKDKYIDNMRIAIIGDLKHGRTAHSLIILLSLFENITFYLISPKLLKMPANLKEYAEQRGHTVIETGNLEEGVSGVSVIYTTRYQAERFNSNAEIQEEARLLKLNKHIYDAYAKNSPVILHPLPRDMVFGELSTDMDDIPNLAIFRQTDNGVSIRMALFCLIFGLGNKIDGSLQKTAWHSN